MDSPISDRASKRRSIHSFCGIDLAAQNSPLDGAKLQSLRKKTKKSDCTIKVLLYLCSKQKRAYAISLSVEFMTP